MSEAIRVPVRKITKAEMVWLGEHFCRHGHTFLEHYSCFLSEAPDTSPLHENIGIFDIETTGLKAPWSHMLSWCVKEHGKDIIHSDTITTREARDKNDKRIIKSAIKEIAKYDRLVTWYGTRFDLPWTRSRAIWHDIEFPAYRDLYHTDLYFVARSKLAMHSNRLQAVCQFFGIEAKTHPMTPDLWGRAGSGQQEALDEIFEHNKEDVISTDECFLKLVRHMMITKRSI